MNLNKIWLQTKNTSFDFQHSHFDKKKLEKDLQILSTGKAKQIIYCCNYILAHEMAVKWICSLEKPREITPISNPHVF